MRYFENLCVKNLSLKLQTTLDYIVLLRDRLHFLKYLYS